MTEASPCPLDEEPEEDLTVEQVKEKAEAGDARAQTRVRENTYTQFGTWHQSGSTCFYFWLLGR